KWKVSTFANEVLKAIETRGLDCYTGKVQFRFNQRWRYPNVQCLGGLVTAFYFREHMRWETINDDISDGEMMKVLKDFARKEQDRAEFKAVVDFLSNKRRFNIF
ncbi:unnamed protein product, partial [Allacma fusca]